MLKKASIFLSVIVTMVLLLALQAAAADTPAPVETDITITNNLTGTPDSVEIDNVSVNDIIKVYSTSTSSLPIGVTVAGSTNPTFYINQLGSGGGTVYVTVTSGSSSESARTAAVYLAEEKTDTPVFDEDADISVQNRVGLPDIITLSILTDGDIVRVYQNSVSTAALGTVVSTGASASVYINQLGVAAGRVYITVQSTGKMESNRTPFNYASETTTILNADDVEVVNNFVGTNDTVTVPGVAVDDTITVYKTLLGTETWASMTVTAGDIVDEKVKINITQLGAKAGKIYVTIKTSGKAESKRATVPYIEEPTATAPKLITVTNNYDKDDQVDVSGLLEGDVIHVYNSPVSLVSIGTDTVGTGETTASATVLKGQLAAAGGKVYVTVTSAGMNESGRATVTYGKEDANKALPASKVEVTNACKGTDTLKVKELTIGDTISIYSTPTGATLIQTKTATSDTLVFSLGTSTLLAKGGNIYVTITTSAAGESPRTSVSYKKEDVTPAPVAKDISVVNNYSASDPVTVPGLTEYAVVRVYSSLTGATEIGTATVAASATSTTVLIDDKKLLAVGGKIYVSVESLTENESIRVAVTYPMETTATAPPLSNIIVTNNFEISDTIEVLGLAEKYIVNIYFSQTGSVGKISGTVADGDNKIAFTLDDKVLSATGGKIYVSVKYPFSNEGPRTAFTYTSEKSTAPLAANVKVTNNYYIATDAATKDTVKILGVEVDDIITIYKASGGTATWAGPVKALAAGDMDITIDQLGSKPGNIYVSVIKRNKSESTRTGVSFKTEPVTDTPALSSIIIDNNYAADDVVTINNLTANQIINIYTTTTGPAILTPVTATGTSYTYVLDNGVLAASGGKLYVSVKDPDKLESSRAVQAYTSETTVSPKTGNILVVNYPGDAYDTVTLVGLTSGDIVTIYTASGTLLSKATVGGKGTTLTLDTNLPDSAGTIYVTVTNEGKAESKKVAVPYQDA